MNKIIYIFISSLIFSLASCDKNDKPMPPVIGGAIFISFQNEQGEDLLDNIELKYIGDDNTGKYINTNVLTFNSYKINSWIELDSKRQDFYIKYLVFKELNKMKGINFEYSFTAYTYKMGVAVYEFSCPYIFEDDEDHKITISFEDIKGTGDIELIDCEIDGKKGIIIDKQNKHILFKINK